jgi:hypothetical protein
VWISREFVAAETNSHMTPDADFARFRQALLAMMVLRGSMVVPHATVS